MQRTLILSCAPVLASFALAGCEQASAPVATITAAAPAAAISPFRIQASIQELMDSIIDPSADSLWDSVGTSVTAQGTVEHQPHTDADWQDARRHAIALIEGTNLLIMDGRKIVAPGAAVLDQGVQGVLSPEDAAKRFDSQHAAFVQFAYALHDVGDQMLKAIDAKDPKAMMAAGDSMDAVCEGCHLTFWYPNQVIPQLPATLDPTQLLRRPRKGS